MKLVIAVLLAFSTTTYAGEGHNHEAAVEAAPHGGYLRDAPPFKAELVVNGTEAKIYVYDSTLEPLAVTANELQGKFRFPKERKDRKVTFKRAGDFFSTQIPGIDKIHRWDLHVTLKELGKSVVLDFGIDNIH